MRLCFLGEPWLVTSPVHHPEEERTTFVSISGWRRQSSLGERPFLLTACQALGFSA